MRYVSRTRMSTPILLLALSLAGPTPGATVTSVTPIFGQLIALSLPDGFRGAFQDTRNGFYIQESVLPGETVTSRIALSQLGKSPGERAHRIGRDATGQRRHQGHLRSLDIQRGACR